MNTVSQEFKPEKVHFFFSSFIIVPNRTSHALFLWFLSHLEVQFSLSPVSCSAVFFPIFVPQPLPKFPYPKPSSVFIPKCLPPTFSNFLFLPPP